MRKTTAAPATNSLATVDRLLEMSGLDTLYRDIYFQRARKFLENTLSSSAYVNAKESAAKIPWAERQLRAAVERGEWERTRSLSAQLRELRGLTASNSGAMTLGASVYEGAGDIPIDPFSPGLHGLAGVSQENLGNLKAKAIRELDELEAIDGSMSAFYRRRRDDFQSLSQPTTTELAGEDKAVQTGSAALQQQAFAALESGDLTRLDQIVNNLMTQGNGEQTKQEIARPEIQEAVELGDDLLCTFTDATLAAAKRLGLSPARTQSRRHFAYLIPRGWQPSFMKDDIKSWAKDELTRLTYPTGTTEKNREAIEFLLLNPFITSAGTRYEVCLVIEDLLLEDFPDPEPKAAMPQTDLLAALKLESRWGLARTAIEVALLEHGPRILKDELSLDPEMFRLVAIPPDIFTHLATDRGWGQNETWTHFDGYRVLAGGKLQALAGGDRRFGGSHDVVAFGANYNNDKILVRFAVVQRKRMMTWHRR